MDKSESGVGESIDPGTDNSFSAQLDGEKAQILQIDFPPNNALLGSKVIVRGRAVPQNPSEEVVVEVNRTLYPPRDVNGYWQVEDDLTSLTYPTIIFAAMIRSPMLRVSRAVTWQKNCPSFIGFPAGGTVLPQGQPFTITGQGITGSTVTVTNVSAGLILGTRIPGARGYWEMQIVAPTSGTSFIIEAVHDGLGGSHVPHRVTYVLAPTNKTPEITLPLAGTVQDRKFRISGKNGVSGSTMQVFIDLTQIKVGDEAVTGDDWSVPVVLPDSIPPGEVRLVAQQTLNGTPSDRSVYRAFKLKPPQPTKLTAQVDAQGNVTLGGVGHIGATFDLHVVGNMTPFRSFTVSTTPWSVLFPDWLPGTSLIGGRQSVPDGAGQPIYSDWTPESTTVVVPVPPPTLSFRVSPEEGIPTFSGTGRNWSGQPASRVEVRLNNAGSAIVPIVDVRADTTWSSTAIERWAPGKYQVTATQWFTTLQSNWVLPLVSVVISSPLAVIEKVTPNGLFAKVNGQCWPGAVVTITFSDSPTPHPVTDTDKNGEWDFQRPAAFRPGRHTVTVTQTFGGQTSNPVTTTFEIAVSVLVITPPPGGQTDHLPVLHGTGGIDGFTISVFDYVTHELLGEALATGDAWSVQLTELDYLTHTVFAVQKLGDLQSQRSTSVAFKVVLFAPRINFPITRTSVPRTFTVEGYARAGKGFDRTEVDVYLDDVAHRIYPDAGDGYFKEYFTLPLGPCVLTARQYFKDQESPPAQEILLTIVPDKALIETPGTGEAVGQTAVICGFGYPEDTVVVALPGGAELGQARVQEDGTWFCPVELPESGANLSFITEQRNGEFHSGWSQPRAVQRLEHPPTFGEPPEGNWEGTTPGFAGSALANSKVDVFAWYDPDENHAEGLLTNGGRWAGVPERNLPAGPQWARAVQIVGGKRSMAADSKRFEVLPADEPRSS
ncbi:hypothetical protein [Pseudomonas sp. 91RF]|uniref:hypothetical protein n=1 Tax=Pseudomonas sp. 91RF TaxID=2292261 RepID=UPI0011C40A14|nr:hypothetical protein [Pseudomonas sp. 91RF]